MKHRITLSKHYANLSEGKIFSWASTCLMCRTATVCCVPRECSSSAHGLSKYWLTISYSLGLYRMASCHCEVQYIQQFRHSTRLFYKLSYYVSYHPSGLILPKILLKGPHHLHREDLVHNCAHCQAKSSRLVEVLKWNCKKWVELLYALAAYVHHVQSLHQKLYTISPQYSLRAPYNVQLLWVSNTL